MKLLPLSRILFAVAAFPAVLIYLIWWATYAGIHFNERYTIRPPGAAAEVQGASMRLLSLVRAGELGDAKGGSPALPEPGAVWVVAELETVRQDPGKEFYCELVLLGPQERKWTEAVDPVTRSAPHCETDNPVGQPVRFESVFMVPARYTDQLIGIALNDASSAARTPVVTPPQQ